MAQNGYGAAPVAGHIGRIPNYGKTQVNPMGSHEPPACIQNAMMTKDKKPFTYTPGGLDLSQIRTPSMARRLARQRSWEEQEQPQYTQQPSNGGYHPQGGPAPPPPPPPKMPVPPPPPPPIVIQVPDSKSPKPIVPGERPEIVIPENPIGMLRKTNSPYHWEAEKAELQKLGQTPRYVQKVPSPLTVKMPPSSFTQQQPQSYTPQNNYSRSYSNQNQPESPIHRPEAQYAHQKSSSPHGSPPTREILQRQDSQFNKSPQPYAGQTPISGSSPYSPSPNNNWRQPEKRDSPASNVNPTQSPQYNRGAFSPNTQQYSVNNQQYSPNNQQYSPNTQQYSPNTQQYSPSNQQYSPNTQQYSPNKPQYSPNIQNQSPLANSSPAFHTLPRAGQRNIEAQNNAIYNNTKPSPPTEANAAPWRSATLNRHPKEPESQTIYNNVNTNQEQPYVPPWKVNQTNNTSTNNENAYIPPWKQENKQQQKYTPPWVQQDSNNNKVPENNPTPWRHQEPSSSPPKPNPVQEPPRFQTTMSIPVTPRKQNSQPEYKKEVVYVNEEPVYYCPESPKSIPPWVKTQKEKTKTPPPAWVQRPLEARKSQSRELATPPRDNNQEPEWVKKSNEMQRGVREVISPPKYQQPVQPAWSTRPSENRKSLPRENGPGSPGTRVIPIQMEVSTTETRDNRQSGHQPHPQLRITIGMNQNPNSQDGRAPFSPPTQRIMRVLSPQLVRLEDPNPQPDLPTLNRSFQEQPKTRIIPIQIEGGNGGTNKRVYYHKFTQEGPPRQSKAFKVLQIITGTEDSDDIQQIENHHGFTDL